MGLLRRDARRDDERSGRRRSRRSSPPAPPPIANAAREVFARLRAALVERRSARRRARSVGAVRLARQRLGEAGHPARLPLRRHRRRVGRSRPLAVLRQGHAAAEALGRREPACASCPADRRSATARISAAASSACRRCTSTSARTSATSTLIDSHALVGSCAQIGARVHVSAAAQIGGVLEPVGALPVIIEDDVLVGGNCGVYEGAVVKRRAVLAAGHDPDRLDADLRSAERADHRAGSRASR